MQRHTHDKRHAYTYRKDLGGWLRATIYRIQDNNYDKPPLLLECLMLPPARSLVCRTPPRTAEHASASTTRCFTTTAQSFLSCSCKTNSASGHARFQLFFRRRGSNPPTPQRMPEYGHFPDHWFPCSRGPLKLPAKICAGSCLTRPCSTSFARNYCALA